MKNGENRLFICWWFAGHRSQFFLNRYDSINPLFSTIALKTISVLGCPFHPSSESWWGVFRWGWWYFHFLLPLKIHLVGKGLTAVIILYILIPKQSLTQRRTQKFSIKRIFCCIYVMQNIDIYIKNSPKEMYLTKSFFVATKPGKFATKLEKLNENIRLRCR